MSQCIYDIANAKRFFVYKNLFPASCRTERQYKKSTVSSECFLLLSTLLLLPVSWNNANIILSRGGRFSGRYVFVALYKQYLITTECWFFSPGRLYKLLVFYKPFYNCQSFWSRTRQKVMAVLQSSFSIGTLIYLTTPSITTLLIPFPETTVGSAALWAIPLPVPTRFSRCISVNRLKRFCSLRLRNLLGVSVFGSRLIW